MNIKTIGYAIPIQANFARRKVTQHKRRLASGKTIIVGGGRFRKDVGKNAARGAIGLGALGSVSGAVLGTMLAGPAGGIAGGLAGGADGAFKGGLLGAGAGATRYGVREMRASRARKKGQAYRIKTER